MSQRLLAISAALMLASLFVGCSIAGEAGSFGGTGESRNEHASGGGDLTVRFSITVDRGEIGVRILDPSGDERYASEFRAGDSLSRPFEFPGERGLWVAVFALQDAEGRYEVEWLE